MLLERQSIHFAIHSPPSSSLSSALLGCKNREKLTRSRLCVIFNQQKASLNGLQQHGVKKNPNQAHPRQESSISILFGNPYRTAAWKMPEDIYTG